MLDEVKTDRERTGCVYRTSGVAVIDFRHEIDL